MIYNTKMSQGFCPTLFTLPCLQLYFITAAVIAGVVQTALVLLGIVYVLVAIVVRTVLFSHIPVAFRAMPSPVPVPFVAPDRAFIDCLLT